MKDLGHDRYWNSFERYVGGGAGNSGSDGRRMRDPNADPWCGEPAACSEAGSSDTPFRHSATSEWSPATSTRPVGAFGASWVERQRSARGHGSPGVSAAPVLLRSHAGIVRYLVNHHPLLRGISIRRRHRLCRPSHEIDDYGRVWSEAPIGRSPPAPGRHPRVTPSSRRQLWPHPVQVQPLRLYSDVRHKFRHKGGDPERAPSDQVAVLSRSCRSRCQD